MKKRNKKLRLNRETLRNLSGDDLQKVGGAGPRCGSNHCTALCPATTPGTYCICPLTYSVPPVICDP
ncbi:MAG: class I lanthipeptide [Holophagales bacterium]|nr:class I lanthipeptide [Holophagales bacterium]